MAAKVNNSLEFIREIECEKSILHIHQSYIGDVGCVVWDAALVLCKFLEHQIFFPSPHYWSGKRIIELGAGTGAVGLVAGLLGGEVTITDLSSCLSLMQTNIKENEEMIKKEGGGKVEAKVLVWGQGDISVYNGQHFDIILMADLIYYEESLDDLVYTVRELSNCQTIVIMSYEVRTTGNKQEIMKKFFDKMSQYFMNHEVDYNDMDESCRSQDIKIFFFKLIESS